MNNSERRMMYLFNLKRNRFLAEHPHLRNIIELAIKKGITQ